MDYIPVCLVSHPCGIYSTAATKNFEWIVTAGEDGLFRIWDFHASMLGKVSLTNNQRHGLLDSITKGGVLLSEFSIQKPGLALDAPDLTFNPGTSVYPTSLILEEEAVWMLVGSKDGNIILTSLRFDQGKVHQVLGKENGNLAHESTVSVLKRISVSSNANLLLSGSWDKKIKLWDLNTGALISEYCKHASQITSIQVHPQSVQNNLFMSTGIDGGCLIWDLRQPQPVANRVLNEAKTSWILASCWNGAGDRFYCGRRNGFVEEWDLRSTAVRRKFKPPIDVGSVYQLHCMPGDEELMVVTFDNIRMWHLNQKKDSGDLDLATPFYIVPANQGCAVSDLLFDSEYRFMVESTGNRGWFGSSSWEGCLFFDLNQNKK